jgi:hypothetical protein
MNIDRFIYRRALAVIEKRLTERLNSPQTEKILLNVFNSGIRLNINAARKLILSEAIDLLREGAGRGPRRKKPGA